MEVVQFYRVMVLQDDKVLEIVNTVNILNSTDLYT